MKTLLISILIVAIMSNCQDDIGNSEISRIEFGTSFGMCFGYCTQMVTFTNEKVIKTLTARPNSNLKEKLCSTNWNGFNTLTAKVNSQSFMSLEETIGCPDCADGGAEWIEIFTTEGSKKVTYEYGKEPKEVKNFIEDLRKYYDQLVECE